MHMYMECTHMYRLYKHSTVYIYIYIHVQVHVHTHTLPFHVLQYTHCCIFDVHVCTQVYNVQCICTLYMYINTCTCIISYCAALAYSIHVWVSPAQSYPHPSVWGVSTSSAGPLRRLHLPVPGTGWPRRSGALIALVPFLLPLSLTDTWQRSEGAVNW